MRKLAVIISGAAVLGLVLTGCATTGKGVSKENDDLKAQIQTLQTQLQEKSAEVDSLRKTLSSTTEEKYAAAKFSAGREAATEHPSVKDVQSALKNAGYDIGVADGRMGKKTRQAIKDFQKANGLDADGKVGKKTWSVLSTYLDKKPVK
jgi:peptidoglycan hydrolase-like protein with peptidoglycan-binding domain